MDINALNANLNRDKWGVRNFRALKSLLVKEVQESLSEFMPLTSSSYYNNPIQVLDFFSGAGGTSLGFAALNTVIPTFKMLGGCDINQISAQTYSRNFDTPVIHEDIVRLANEEGALETLLESIGFDTNKPTILIGCAPCQGFSSHRKRHWDEEDDVRNSLVMAFATIVGKIMPDVIVMENVPEFLSQKYWRYFSAAKKSYQQLGYTVKEHIYNAAAFGVPQDRFRTIVIGMKKEFLLPEGYLTPNEYRTVRDAISKLPPVAAGVADPNDPMHKSAAHKQSTIDVIRQVPHDGGSRPEGVGPECLDRVRGFYDVYGRLYWDKPSITITHYARNPASGRYTHPEQDRGLTAREAALLQSFPNGFEFTGKSDDIYRQIGEAVPPLLSSAIAGKRGKTILQQLIEDVEQIGYKVHVDLLDAQDYGVPQRRKRYIIVGERNDLGEHYKYPEPVAARHTVRDTIGNLPAPPSDGTDHPEISLHRRDRLSELNLKRMQAIKEGQGRDDLPEELLADCHKVDSSVIGFRSVYGRMAWDDVAPTITARFDSFTRGKFGHPVQDRSISLREGALLQSFPMDFVFTGNKVDIARQIGNAVPPLLAEKIGQSIIECYRKVGEK